eukprot:CAMPEP_0116115892 /NCGR_PEP_ID=MMETSP0329-20121206/747_1 /TAXON_ID=697910 /ORGANISM="Pseudo-nitzschia arenysensis, Strain B593" /LENGTH=177 /DNA_ID=CAMNT_0003609351 /DNA_START=773 /DNA_END=1307 /DNA_ORIENTATION=-
MLGNTCSCGCNINWNDLKMHFGFGSVYGIEKEIVSIAQGSWAHDSELLRIAMRCGWLIAAYMQQSRRDSWAWWISFAWVPTTTVSVVLLYSTRKRDNVAEDVSMTEDNDNVNNIHMNSNEDLRQSLLRPQPPEEAFRAFQSFRRGDEDADDSFSLGSPQPRNISNAAVAASGEGEEP